MAPRMRARHVSRGGGGGVCGVLDFRGVFLGVGGPRIETRVGGGGLLASFCFFDTVVQTGSTSFFGTGSTSVLLLSTTSSLGDVSCF